MRGLVVALFFAAAACKPADSSMTPSETSPAGRIVVVDAGSSGTRVHVYEPSGAALVDLTPACNYGPPLAITGPDAVLGLWRSCNVATLVRKDTRIRVYATGGMRTLAETDPARAAQIHEDVAAALRSLGHVDVESRTIEGVEEARFAWIAANLLRGGLPTDGRGDASVGVLELGGSSTQIAFVPDDPASATETLTLDGRSYPLFAVSYLHCGANEARRELAADSCFFPACEQSPVCSLSLVETPASRGAGEFAACTSSIETALRREGVGCAAASQPRPAMADETFVLADNFAYLMHSFGAVEAGGVVNLERLWAAAEGGCATAWPDLADPLLAAEPARRGRACFDAGLTHALLDLYGVSNSSKLLVLDQAPLWALGAAYLER